MDPLTVAKTMAKRGMLAPGLPHRQITQLGALHKWGFGLAGELRQAAARSPKTVAVIDEAKGSTTNADLLARSERVAAVLLERGYKPGDRLGLLARNHVGAIEVMCATAAIGVDVVLGNTGLGASQLALIAEQQELRGIVFDDEFAEQVAALDPAVGRISESELGGLVEAAPQPRKLTPPSRVARTIILLSVIHI